MCKFDGKMMPQSSLPLRGRPPAGLALKSSRVAKLGGLASISWTRLSDSQSWPITHVASLSPVADFVSLGDSNACRARNLERLPMCQANLSLETHHTRILSALHEFPHLPSHLTASKFDLSTLESFIKINCLVRTAETSINFIHLALARHL